MDDQIELQNACEPDPRGKLLGVRTEQGQRRRPDRAWQCFDRLHAVQAARTDFVRRVELVVKARSYFEPSFVGPRTSAKRTQAPNIPMYRYQQIDGLSRVSFAMRPPHSVQKRA